mgnify:CR=1 FL=1
MSRAPLPAFVVRYTDSSFTNPHEVVRPDAPENRRGRFTHMGACFWGFETRRHRGHRTGDGVVHFDADACHELVLGLRTPAVVDGVAISTAFFTGNQVPELALDLPAADGAWREVLARTALEPDAEHAFELPARPATEARLRCYQEGGIARVLLFGEPFADAPPPAPNLLAGAGISHVSNAHYGDPAMAVRGARAEDHMIGWESARTGFGERALFSLAAPARCETLVVDTYLHRLNAPLCCHLFGLPPGTDPDEAMARAPRWGVRFPDGARLVPDDLGAFVRARRWREGNREGRFAVELVADPDGPFLPLLPFGPLEPDRWHRFALAATAPVAHLLFLFYPNGGIHGLAVAGREAL